MSQNDIIKIVQIAGLEVRVQYKAPRSVDVPKIVLNNNRVRSLCDMQLTPIDVGIKKYLEYLCRDRRE